MAISLIQARDEQELSFILDEIGDPSDCKWKVYKGPLHLGFDLNVDFKDQTNYKFIPSKPKAKILHAEKFLEDGPQFKFLGDESSDTHNEMWDNFMKFCFPELWKCAEKRFEDFSPNEKQKMIQKIESAAMQELSAFFKSKEHSEDNWERMKRPDQNESN